MAEERRRRRWPRQRVREKRRKPPQREGAGGCAPLLPASFWPLRPASPHTPFLSGSRCPLQIPSVPLLPSEEGHKESRV